MGPGSQLVNSGAGFHSTDLTPETGLPDHSMAGGAIEWISISMAMSQLLSNLAIEMAITLVTHVIVLLDGKGIHTKEVGSPLGVMSSLHNVNE